MAITQEQNDRLTKMLQDLEPSIKDMRPNAQQFVRDQIQRHEQWGDKIFISAKQWNWLEALYKEHVGPPPVEEKPDMGLDDAPDIDDDIPF